MIPVFQPYYDDREERAVAEVLRSKWAGLGPKTAEFEERFARTVGARYAVGVSSGTAALQLALQLIDLRPGDDVIVPTITFVSTAHVVKQLGAEPVFAEVDEQTLCLDWQDVRNRITP